MNVQIKTATFVRDLPTDNSGVQQALYKISPPQVEELISFDDDPAQQVYEVYEYVVVSASYLELPDLFTGKPKVAVHETFIFAAREDGSWVSGGELEGSTRGVLDHRYALNAGGWMIVGKELTSGDDD